MFSMAGKSLSCRETLNFAETPLSNIVKTFHYRIHSSGRVNPITISLPLPLIPRCEERKTLPFTLPLSTLFRSPDDQDDALSYSFQLQSAKSSRRKFNHQPDDQHILSQRVMNHHNSHRPQHQYSSSSSDSGNSDSFDSISSNSILSQNPTNHTSSMDPNFVSSSMPAVPLPSTGNYSQYITHQYPNPQSSVMNPFNSHADQRNYQYSTGGNNQNPAYFTRSMAPYPVGSSSSIPASSAVSSSYNSQHPQNAIYQTFQSSAQLTGNQSTPQRMPSDIPSTVHRSGNTSISSNVKQSRQNEEDCEPLVNWMDTCPPRPKKKKSATNLVQEPVNESPCTAFLRAQCLLMGNDLPELRDDV